MNLPVPVRWLLWPLSLVYGAVVRIRAWMYARGWLKQKRLKAPVISVGNLTVGGTGKTPMVIWLAEKFLREGKRVAILSRGYRGTNGTSDEIELMRFRLQDRVIFGVGKDRFAEGSRIESHEPVDLFLLDDGFQHLPLARDVDIVLIDASRPLHKEFLLPAGSKREPNSALYRADVALFTRVESEPFVMWAIQEFPQFPIFPSITKLLGFYRFGASGRETVESMENISGPSFAFCGIGNPASFFSDLERWNVRVSGKKVFRDHHRYSSADLVSLAQQALRSGAKSLVTTEKDAKNLSEAKLPELPIYCCQIAADIPDEKQFLAVIDAKLSSRKGCAA